MLRLGDTKIWVGGKDDSFIRIDPNWAVVNTTKSIHSEIMGWDKNPPREHPNYIVFESGQFISFNWVDGSAQMFEWAGPQSFTRALDFIDKWYEEKDILINCDQGQSRSPTVALLYLAKRMHLISDESFAKAHEEFRVIYPFYSPRGIAQYVEQHWNEIN